MTLTDAMERSLAERCFRCDYDLRGITDNQPCPECGLIAERSRQLTDELHHTRPKWLRRTAWGIWCILYGIAAPFVWAMMSTQVYRNLRANYSMRHLEMIGVDAAVIFIFAGALLITTPEGVAAADRNSRRLRTALRVIASLPIVLALLFHLVVGRLPTRLFSRVSSLEELAIFTTAVIAIPLPLLLFARLKSIAHRARSAHLAEHCTIVGVGNSLTFVYAATVLILAHLARDASWGTHWMGRSQIALSLMLAVGVSALLFAMWNAYLLLRFAVAFAKAAQTQRQLWQAGDRAA